MESITRCASTSCTFANMNTETDVSTLSIVQVQYCADRGFSPAGMVVPSTARASPTGSSGSVDSQTATATATDSSTRTRPTSGPAATSSCMSAFSVNLRSVLVSHSFYHRMAPFSGAIIYILTTYPYSKELLSFVRAFHSELL